MGWKNFGRGITETCYQCEDRYPACHDHCEKYITAKREWFEKQKIAKEAKHKALLTYQHHFDAVRKSKRKG